MSQQILHNGETNLSLRTKINENFSELYKLVEKLSECCPEPDLSCFHPECPFVGNTSFDIAVGNDPAQCRVIGASSGAILAPGLGGQPSTARIIGSTGDTMGYPTCSFEGVEGYFLVGNKTFTIGEEVTFLNWDSILPSLNGKYILKNILYKGRVLKLGCE
jgi:hypothetical protein